MRLRFVRLDDDGTSLVLTEAEREQSAGTDSEPAEFILPVDDGLRAALTRRRQPARSATDGAEHRTADRPSITPRQVQAMMRAGQVSEDIADQIGWDVDRVRRFEPPILAEREFVASTAQAAHVRGRVVDGVFPTLGSRVAQRLSARGVPSADIAWDAARPEGSSWTVSVTFTAGNKQRRAGWTYDAAGRTVEAQDDEARWLSEDEQALPAGSVPGLFPGDEHGDELVSTIREHNRARGRRSRRGRSGGGTEDQTPAPASDDADLEAIAAAVETTDDTPDPAGLPNEDDHHAAVLPLEDLPYDPDTMGPPPSAGRPEEARQPRSRKPRGRKGRSAKKRAGLHAIPDDSADTEVAREADHDTLEPRDITLGDLFEDDEAYDEPESDGSPVDTEPSPVEELYDDQVTDEGTDTDGESAQPDDADADPSAEDPDDAVAPSEQSEASEDTEERPASNRKGRTSVPSWDDIMFGSRGKR